MTDIFNYFLQFFSPQKAGILSENKLYLLLPTFPQFIISRLWLKNVSLNKIRKHLIHWLDLTKPTDAKCFTVYSSSTANLLQMKYKWDNQ